MCENNTGKPTSNNNMSIYVTEVATGNLPGKYAREATIKK